jgi:hypothetical protein
MRQQRLAGRGQPRRALIAVKQRLPSRRSRRRICALTVGSATDTRAAVRAACASRATATKYHLSATLPWVCGRSRVRMGAPASDETPAPACTTIGQCIRPRWTGSVDTTKGPLTRGSRSFAPRPGQTGEGPRACGGHDEALRTRCRRVTAPPNSIGCRSSAACSRCHALVPGHARRRDPTVRTPRPRPGPARTTRLTAARTRHT